MMRAPEGAWANRCLLLFRCVQPSKFLPTLFPFSLPAGERKARSLRQGCASRSPLLAEGAVRAPLPRRDRRTVDKPEIVNRGLHETCDCHFFTRRSSHYADLVKIKRCAPCASARCNLDKIAAGKSPGGLDILARSWYADIPEPVPLAFVRAARKGIQGRQKPLGIDARRLKLLPHAAQSHLIGNLIPT